MAQYLPSHLHDGCDKIQLEESSSVHDSRGAGGGGVLSLYPPPTPVKVRRQFTLNRVSTYYFLVSRLCLSAFIFQGDQLKSFDSQSFPIGKFITALHQNKSLSGRPKVLILECCRGKEVMTGRVKDTIDWPDDFYVLNSTLSGYISATHHIKGSPFVRIFGESLMKNCQKMSLRDIFQEVKEKVSNIKTGVLHPDKGGSVLAMQVPEERSTLKKQLYLCKLHE